MYINLSLKSAVISVISFSLISFSVVSAQQRVWTESKTGNTITAEFLQLEEKMAVLKLSNGKIVKIDPDRLSKLDSDYIDNKILQKNAIGDGSLLGNVDVPEAESVMREILPRRDNVWNYRTRHFVIESPKPLSDSAQKMVGKAFEITWEALRAVPLPTRVKRLDSKFKATLILNYDDYLARGGENINMPNGRVLPAWYSPGEDITYVSFDCIGLNQSGDLKAGNQQVDQMTIVHEVTHQLTENCYNPNVTWICEGLACYIGYVPYDGKKLNFEKVLDKVQTLYHQPMKINTTFKDFLNYDYEKFHSNEYSVHYMASHLLVAYFIHLDGKDGASRLAKYLEASPKKRSDNPPKDSNGHAKGFDELLQGRDINALESSFVEAWKKRGVIITFGSSG